MIGNRKRAFRVACATLAVALLTIASLCPALPAKQPPTHRYYNGERVPLALDGSRLLIRLNQETPEGMLLAELSGRGVAATSLKATGAPQFHLLNLQAPSDDAAAVNSRIEAVLSSPQVAFASPVFEGHFFGWVGMTADILVRLEPAHRSGAVSTLRSIAPDLDALGKEIFGLAGAYQIPTTLRNGFDVLALANRLAEDPRVAWAEPDAQFSGRASLIPDDPGFSNLWGILNTGQYGGTPGEDMDGDIAWDITTGDTAILVQILDDGVQQDHPDLHQVSGRDFTGVGGGGGPMNECDNHGTAVAGCVSAAINNTLGTVGIAPNCRVVATKVCISTTPCDGTGTCQSSWIANAIGWGQLAGARTSNFSWSLGSPVGIIDDAYQNTYDAGVVHFASAGNDGVSGLGYPSSLPTVNSIAALAPSGNRASFSNYGNGLAFSAPGVSIYTTDRTGTAGYSSGDYVTANGTSFASPYSAGLAALVISLDPTLTTPEVEARLQCSSRDKGDPGYDTDYGWGFVNAFNALNGVSVVDSTSSPLGDPGSAAGIAWGDYDNDGDPDLYITNQSGSNKLLENLGGGSFSDATSGGLGDAGDGAGVAWGDYDNDGDLDLYFSNVGGLNRLLRNDGGGTLVEVTSAPLDTAGSATSVAWVDHDLDGDIDLHLVTSSGNKLFRNDGAGLFVDIASGVFASTSSGNGVAWGDYDNDGDPDLYLPRADFVDNKLFQNDGNGQFSDVTSSPLGDPGSISRAAAWGDYDDDGDLDLYLVNDSDAGASNKLFRNEGGGLFADVTHGSLGDTGGGNTAAWGDYDNDGDLDLYLGNLSPDDSKFFLNNLGVFSDITSSVQANSGNSTVAAAWEDYDADGVIDLYLANSGGANKLLRTVAPQAFCNSWLHLDLIGTHSNYYGIGCRVRAVVGGRSHSREISGGCGYSQESMRAKLGVGLTSLVDTLEISWPSGIVQVLPSTPVDTLLSVTEIYVAPVATLVAPNGGEDWGEGTTRNIKWASATDVGSDYTLEYSTNGGVNWTFVASGSAGKNGSYPWVVPSTPTTQARVRVLLENVAGSDRDTSDADFAITAAPIVAVTAPNGGEDLEIGSTVNITWTNAGGVATAYTVEFSTDSGSTWTALADSVPGTGGESIPWTILNSPSQAALVQVSLTNSAGTVPDQSDAFFNMIPPIRAATEFVDLALAAVEDPGVGRGVAWGDHDRDGDIDLYLASSDGPNRLFENQAGTFVDATTGPLGDSLASFGAAWGDYDNDGDLDLYLTNEGENKLFRNDGGGSFSDATGGPLGHTDEGRALAWGDYDNDGDLDIYLANHTYSNQLFRNDGGAGFANTTPPLLAEVGTGWSTAWVDYDNDGDVDLYLVRNLDNKLFANDGDGTFSLVTPGSGGVVADTGIGYGQAWGDYDNDGDLDLYLTNEGANKLLRSDNGFFVDVTTSLLGVEGPAYGVAWGDYDNDGDLDLYLAHKYFNRLFRNDGNGTFADAANQALTDVGNSQGVAWGDYDNDGDLDLYVSNIGANKIYRNELSTGLHWLHVRLIGTVSNEDGIGGRVRVVAGGTGQIREVSGGSGYLSQNSLAAEFGLGSATLVDTLEVVWPSGRVQRMAGVAADAVLQLTEPIPEWLDVTSGPLSDPGAGKGIAWGDYDGDGDLDFYLTLSGGANKLLRNDGGSLFADVTSGPLGDAGTGTSAPWADYDNDGDLDLYLVNTGSPNRLLRNDGSGLFADATSGPLGDPGFGFSAAWGDYNNDGNIDIYLANFFTANRLFRNDGNGAFIDATSGPLGDAGAGFATAWGDYDNDEDLDIYLGNGTSANKLFRNDGDGNFADVTTGPLQELGPTHGIAWGDYDNDGDLDLYFSVDGSANKLLRNDAATFVDATPAPLDDTGNGYGVAWGDYDNDGDLDLYLSQSGSNRLFRNEGMAAFIDATHEILLDAGSGDGVAWADYDNDGDLDIYMANNSGAKRLFRNDFQNTDHWLHVDLAGTVSNRSAIGTRVRAVAGGLSQIREVSGGSGYQSQNSLTAEFGLGSATLVDTLEIKWPSGLVEVFTSLPVDTVLAQTEGYDPTSVDENQLIPTQYRLHPNAPNPFNPVTTIRYELPKTSRVSLKIYDVAGRLVRTLHYSSMKQPGVYEAVWNGRNDRERSVASGVYFYRIEAGDYRKVRKMVLVR